LNRFACTGSASVVLADCAKAVAANDTNSAHNKTPPRVLSPRHPASENAGAPPRRHPRRRPRGRDE
jgi:hypothetical protein